MPSSTLIAILKGSQSHNVSTELIKPGMSPYRDSVSSSGKWGGKIHDHRELVVRTKLNERNHEAGLDNDDIEPLPSSTSTHSQSLPTNGEH